MQVLLLEALRPLDPEVLGHLRQLGDLHPLQVVEAEHLHRGAVRAGHHRGSWLGGRLGRPLGHDRRGGRVVGDGVQVVVPDGAGDGGEDRTEGRLPLLGVSTPLASSASGSRRRRPLLRRGADSVGSREAPRGPRASLCSIGLCAWETCIPATERSGDLQPTRQPPGAPTAAGGAHFKKRWPGAELRARGRWTSTSPTGEKDVIDRPSQCQEDLVRAAHPSTLIRERRDRPSPSRRAEGTDCPGRPPLLRPGRPGADRRRVRRADARARRRSRPSSRRCAPPTRPPQRVAGAPSRSSSR